MSKPLAERILLMCEAAGISCTVVFDYYTCTKLLFRDRICFLNTMGVARTLSGTDFNNQLLDILHPCEVTEIPRTSSNTCIVLAPASPASLAASDQLELSHDKENFR